MTDEDPHEDALDREGPVREPMIIGPRAGAHAERRPTPRSRAGDPSFAVPVTVAVLAGGGSPRGHVRSVQLASTGAEKPPSVSTTLPAGGPAASKVSSPVR